MANENIKTQKGFMSDNWQITGNDVSEIIRLNALSNTKDEAAEYAIRDNSAEFYSMLETMDEYTSIINVTPKKMTIYAVSELSQALNDGTMEGNYMIVCLTPPRLIEPVAIKAINRLIQGNEVIFDSFKRVARVTKGASIMRFFGISISSLAEIRENKFFLIYKPDINDVKSRIMLIPGKYLQSTLCRRIDMKNPKDADIMDIAYMAKKLNSAEEFSLITRSNSAGTKALACMGPEYAPLRQAEVKDIIACLNVHKRCAIASWRVSHYETSVDVIFTDSIIDESYAVGARFSYSDMGRESPSIVPYIFYEDGMYPYGERVSLKMDGKFTCERLVNNFLKKNKKTLEEMGHLFEDIEKNMPKTKMVNEKAFIRKYLLAVSNANSYEATFPDDAPLKEYSGYGIRKIKELFIREENNFEPFSETPVDVLDAVKRMMLLYPRHRDDPEEEYSAQVRLNKAISLVLQKLAGH